MSLTATERTQLVELTTLMFNAAPGATYLAQIDTLYESNGRSIATLATQLAQTAIYQSMNPVFQTSAEFATKFLTPLGLQNDAVATDFIVSRLNGGASKASVVAAAFNALNAIVSTDAAIYKTAQAILNNKTNVAEYYSATLLGTATDLASLQNVISSVTDTQASVDSAKASLQTTTGSTLALTTGADTFTGTAGNDTINASDVAAGATWTVGDKIDGGAGSDTFNVTQTANFTGVPTGATVTNVETLNLLSGGTVTLDTTTGFSGLTALNATSKGGATLTAAATTDVGATESDLKLDTTSQLIVNGGKNVTISATGTTNNSGGTAFVATTGAGAEILVGATTAAAGDVSITNSFKGSDTQISGDIFVKGGKTVTVTQKLTNTTVNATNVQGAVSVVGDANTTAVTVNQDATATASATGLGRVGKTAGAVTISDKNAASTTAAGTIATVTLKNAGDATINSGALTTLNLAGTLGAVDASTLGALTTAANSTLALNLTGAKVATGKTLTIDTDIKTLNVSGNTTSSTIATLDASGATKINVSGDAKVTFTNNTTAAVTDIVVTNTAGASFGTALGTAVNFTGGAGADSIKLSTGFTKAITMGAGNDTVTYNTGTGTGYSVAAGDGTDTIVMTSAQADSGAGASSNSTFNTKFTGFEVLEVSNALANTVDLDGINGATKVVLDAGANAGTLNNLVSGGTVELDADGTGALTIGVKGALLGVSDSVNLVLANTSATNFRTITAANVETVNINVADAGASGSAAVTHSLTLAATSATSVVVTGNNGLNLTNTGNVKITNFDASGVVANDTVDSAGVAATTDSAANLAVTFASADTTATDTVTIKGGAGNDVLVGNVTKDVITGGAGADQLYGDNQGTKEVQTLTLTHVSTGTDTITIDGIATTYTTSTTAALDATAAITAINANTALKGLVSASSGGAGVVTLTSVVDGDIPTSSVTGGNATAVVATTTAGTAGTTAVDTIDGGSGADLIVGGGGADTLTGGTGADTFFFMKGHSNQAALATITDYTYAVGGTSNDKIVIGDVVAAAGTVTTVQDLSAQATLAAAFDAAALGNSVDNGLVVFAWGGNEYVYVETTGTNATYTAGDFAVKLVGTPVAAATVIAGAGLGFDGIA